MALGVSWRTGRTRPHRSKWAQGRGCYQEKRPLSEHSLSELVDKWNEGDEAALVDIYDRWGERIIRAVYQNSRVARGSTIYGSSDMRQTVLRWMLLYARSRRVYATRPEHVEALFRTFVKRAVIRADARIREHGNLDLAFGAVAQGLADELEEAREERQGLLRRVRRLFNEKDWEAVELVSRDVPQRTIAEMQGRSYQYLRLQLARRRGAARRELMRRDS